MVVEGSRRIVLDDVVSGEVWLAAGQSNMEWTVTTSADADREIEAAHHPSIRVLKVERQARWEPTDRADGVWTLSSPDSVGSFSAIAYHFARELHEHLALPVGVIDCSWGGTPIAAWTSVEGLRALVPDIDAELAALRAQLADEPALRAEYQARLAAWEKETFPPDPPHTGEARGFTRPEFDDTGWESLRLPALWQHHGMRFNGVVWFRRAVELPGSWMGRELVLSLGAIDDFDHTYFGGELVGSHPAGTPEAFQTPRRYSIPGRLVRPGRNVIAVRVFDHFGEGGFAGPTRSMALAPADAPDERISLAGEWRIHPEYPIPLVPPSIFATYPQPPAVLTPQCIPSQLHNGMIAPVAPFGIRGLLWYQGESDTERHRDYARRLIALIRDLRHAFARGSLPFLCVELAGYRGGPQWPLLREAQQQAASEPNTVLVTARDIGDPDNIHPPNKQEVARRLALAARARVYGMAIEASSPRLDRIEIDNDVARVWFTAAHGLRSRNPHGLAGFELAGKDGQYHPADARIAGSHVQLRAPDVAEPVHVRYAFTDTGEGDLENDAGLPALSFRTDNLPAEP